MTTTNTTTGCDRLLDDLAALADDDPSAARAHADHLTTCDACRDARHDAREVAREIAFAGEGFRDTDEFHARVMNAVDQGLASASAEPLTQPSPAHEQPLAPKGRGVGVRGGVKGRILFVLAAAAVIAAAVVGVRALWTRAPDPTPTPVATVAPLTARVDLVSRPGAAGLTLRGRADAPLAAGESVPAGSVVLTDPRTRARLVLSDGSVLVLDHDTEVTLDAAAPRGLRIARGSVLADVAHLASGPTLSLSTAHGRVEVLGTKLVVTAADDRTNVEVIRGVVRVAPLGARAGWAEVQAGQEGIVAADGKPRVMPATHLASAVQWAELDGPETSEERGSSGLGVLRARRPGERDGREHPLSLALHRVSVRIAGTVARTEIEERFANDGPNVLEGTYEFPLPSDARIVRLALDVDGRLVDGAIVERERATQIWAGVLRHATPVALRQKKEEFVWVPGPWRDPALLEWRAGGRFGLRIFPIPANGARRVVLAYEQVIAPHGDGRRYVYPLPQPVSAQARAARFEMDARVTGADPTVPVVARGYESRVAREGQATRVRFAEDGFVPAGDFVVDWALPHRDAELRSWAYSKNAGDGHGWALLALRPTLPGWTESRRQDVALVVDSSQSMTGERYGRASELAAAVIAEMDRRDRFVLLACDARCQSMPGGVQSPSAEAAAAARAFLGTVQPAGASDLAAALRTAAHATNADRAVRVVYIGDGTATVGPRRTAALEAEVAALSPAASVTTVGVGGDADEIVLAAIARAGGGQFVAYRPTESLGTAALAVAETMIGPRLEDARLELPAGLEEIAPAALPTIRSGDEVIVTARLAGPVQGEAILRGKVGGAPFERRYPLALEPAQDAGNAFVPAVWADRRIADLDREDAPDATDRIVALSKQYGVVSRHTSLLVLESEAMFRAFGVEHTSPMASWSGEDEPVATEASAAGSGLAQSANPPGNPAGHAARYYGPGTDSTSEPRGGNREIRGLVAPGASRSNDVQGAIDAGAIRRVINSHIGEVQRAYESTLRSNPNATGRLVVSFTILPSGAVDAVEVRGGDGLPAEALASVVRRWRFPAPAGGPVRVSYPFLFRTTGEGGQAQEQPGRDGENRDAERNEEARAKRPPTKRTHLEADEHRPVDDVTSALGTPPGGRPGFGAGRWMRRRWVREGAVRAEPDVRPAERTAVERAEASLTERPDSRDRHEALVHALARVGDVDRALELAEKWLGRDPLDPDALVALSDALARKGRRDESLRVLSGVVDVRPDERALHERLAAAYDRIGDADRACAHRVTLAEIAPEDAAVVGAAVRCEKAAGRDAAADRIVARIGDAALRERVATEAAKVPTLPRVSGDVTIDATWSGDEDVDVALVTPKGARLSWMGGRTTVAAEDASTAGRERLGLRFATAGSYVVEVTRTTPGADTPIRGRLAIQALGSRRTIDFVLDGDRATVARVDVTRREVLSPVF